MQLVTTLVGVLQVVETPVVMSLTGLLVVPVQSSQPPVTVLQTADGVTVEAEQVVPIARPPPLPHAEQLEVGVHEVTKPHFWLSGAVLHEVVVVQPVVNLASPVTVVVAQLVTVLTGGVEQITVVLGVPDAGVPVVFGVPVVMVEVMVEVVVIVLQTGVGDGVEVAQEVVTATPPPTAQVEQVGTALHELVMPHLSSGTGQHDDVVVQADEVLGAPVEVIVLHEVTGVTAGVVHDELGPQETLITLLKLAQTGVGVVLPVEQVEETATPPPTAHVEQLLAVEQVLVEYGTLPPTEG